MPANDDNAERGEWLDNQNDRKYPDNESRRFKDCAVIEEHADGDEKEDRECIAHWQDIRGGLIADFRLSHNHATKAWAESQRGTKGDVGYCRDANRHNEPGKRE